MAIIDRRGVILSASDAPASSTPNPDLAMKTSVRVATTGPIDLQAFGLGTVDGVALAASDRVLVKDQTDATQNGIYNASTGIWQRSADMRDNNQIAGGLQFFVLQGAIWGLSGFSLETPDPITLGTTALAINPHKATAAQLVAGTDNIHFLTPRDVRGRFTPAMFGLKTGDPVADTALVQTAIDQLAAMVVADGVNRELWFDDVYVVGGRKSGLPNLHANGFSIIDLKSGVDFAGPGGLKLADNTNQPDSVFTATFSGTTMTVTGITSGALAAGQFLSGAGTAPVTKIDHQLTGTTGGPGTYQTTTSNTIASPITVKGVKRMVELVGAYNSTSNVINGTSYGILFDYNGANNCALGTIWSFNAVCSVQTGSKVSFVGSTFRNNCGSNTLVLGTYQTTLTLSDVVIAGCTFDNDGDRINAASVDYSTIFSVVDGLIAFGNHLTNGPAINGAAFEVYGRYQVFGNKVKNYYSLANNVAIAGQTTKGEMFGNSIENCSMGVTLWTLAPSSRLDVEICDNQFEANISAAGGPYVVNGVDQVDNSSEVRAIIRGNRWRSDNLADVARTADGISLKAAFSATIEGNHIKGIAGRGIYIKGSTTPTSISIAGNTLLDVGYTTADPALKKGIVLAAAGVTGDLNISGNVINPISGYTLTTGIENALSVDGGFIRNNLVLGATTAIDNTGAGVTVGNTLDSIVQISASITPTALSGDVNDYNPTGLPSAAVIRLSGGAADRNITGLAGVVTGRIIEIVNIGTTNSLVLKDQNASSTAANRFLFGADVTIGPNKAIVLRYDEISARWRAFDRALVNTGVTAGSYGDATHVGSYTVDIQGRLSAAGNVLITPAIGNVTGLGTGVSAALAINAGTANGFATLDGGGKLTSGQIPASLVGAVQYQGTWNASTNSPALASGTGTRGQYYKVGTAGATAIDGISQWNVGDSIIFDGTTWDKIDGLSSEVITVAGKFGNVTLVAADISNLGTGMAAMLVASNAISAPAATFPAGTYAVLGDSLSQTVTNKVLNNTNTATLKDTLFTLQDDGDTTKQAQFQLSGITTGTLRTYTLPDASGTLLYSGGPLGTPASGTLTNCITATLAVDNNTTSPASTAFVLGQAAAATPLVANPTAAAGTATRFARADHVHPASQISMLWSAGNLVVLSSGTFFIGTGYAAGTENVVAVPMPCAGTIKNLYVSTNTPPGSGKNYTATLRKAAADTTVTCAINGVSATTANDTTHSFTVAAGDLVSLKLVVDAGAATAAGFNAGFVFQPST